MTKKNTLYILEKIVVQDYEGENLTPGKVNCPACEGRGRILMGFRDPIEGSKMMDRVDCNLCYGHGILTTDTAKGVAVEAYWCALAQAKTLEHERKTRQEQKREKLVASAMAKLTSEEKEALGL